MPWHLLFILLWSLYVCCFFNFLLLNLACIYLSFSYWETCLIHGCTMHMLVHHSCRLCYDVLLAASVLMSLTTNIRTKWIYKLHWAKFSNFLKFYPVLYVFDLRLLSSLPVLTDCYTVLHAVFRNAILEHFEDVRPAYI